MSSVASSPWIAVFAAGATLANPGGFIPLALKSISEDRPEPVGLRRSVARCSPSCRSFPSASPSSSCSSHPTARSDSSPSARVWLEGHLRLLASVIILLLAVSLLRNGIAGLTG